MHNNDITYRVFNSYNKQTENPIEDAVTKLKTVNEGAKILQNKNDYLSDSLRYIIVFGIHSGFSSCFEIVEHMEKSTPGGKAFIIWSKIYLEEYKNIYKLYKTFRNLMEHQGYYIGPSRVVYEVDINHDCDYPVRRYPHFVEKLVDGKVVETYSLGEWVKNVYDSMYRAFCNMEKIRRFIINGNKYFLELSSIIGKYLPLKKIKKNCLKKI